MAGEIANAFLVIQPSMRGFGTSIAQQAGPQIAAAGRQLGTRGGVALGAALGGSAAKSAVPALEQVNSAILSAQSNTSGWLTQTAQMAFKNVALYGSMFLLINSIKDGISSAIDAMVGFNGELEQANIGFTTLLGSSAAARDQMQWIKDFAKETPFGYEDLVGYSQQLIALGFNAEQSREVLEATGDAAAALGRGSESIQRINLALGQMWTKGKVQSQEMLQLTEAGIGSWQILADAYGTSVEEVQDAVTAGLVKATDAVPALIEGMNARFGGLMEKQSATYAGIISNIQDTLEQQFAEAGEPLFRVLAEQAQQLLEALDDPEVIEMMGQLGGFLADGASALSEFLKFAWEWRDVILAVGVGYAALKVAQGWTIKHFSAEAVAARQTAGAWAAATEAQRAYAAGLTRTSAALAGLSKLNLSPILSTVGMMGGSALLFDGWSRSAEQATADTQDLGQSVAGMAEAMGGGALAGAGLGLVFGGPVAAGIGAAGGAVVGLVGNLWQMQAAMDAANRDTSLAAEALQKLGVEARLAELATSGMTNEQFAAVGGFEAIANAMRSGTYTEYVDGLRAQSAAIKEQMDALQAQSNALMESGDTSAETGEKYRELAADLEGLFGASHELDTALQALDASSLYLAQSQEQVVAAAYQAAFAMDMQTGSLGSMTEAAWQAIIAEGGLGAEALMAALRMEGLAGTAGYVTEMISGIPNGTPINFTTNASDIAGQIIGLRAAAEAGFSSLGMTADGYERQLASLQARYASALSTVSTRLTLPTSGGRSSGVGRAVSRAADDAAKQLERDRAAQLRFGDAFGAIMDAALKGNFEQYRDRLEDQIVSLTRDGYGVAADTLKRLSETLTQASLDYAALTNKLGAASDAYDDLTGRMLDQYNASRELILGLGKATDAQSFDQLAYLLGETTSAAVQYQDVLRQLKEQGLSEALWNQLAQAGPESAGLAQSILAQGQEGIDQLNSLSGSLVDAADSMGNLVSQSMYQQGVDAMQAYIEGLKSQSAALENQLVTIGNNVLNKTASAITPGNAGYLPITNGQQTTANTYQVALTVNASDFGDLQSIQNFIQMLESAPTTQLVDAAGTVIS